MASREDDREASGRPTLFSQLDPKLLVDVETPTEEEIERRRRELLKDSFDYFVHETDEKTGLVLDKTADGWPASIAAMGMALGCWAVGVERDFLARDDAARRTLTMLRFLDASEQSDAADATGYRGFYYHFLDMKTGRRAWNCELSSIDTALLICGVRTARAFFDHETAQEDEIRRLADRLYSRVEWDWMVDRGATICHGWKPESGFLPYHWHGYDEALILYLLALGSPTHPIRRENYDAWCSTYLWKEVYGWEYLYAGPLFIHQMSHIWCDLRDIRDAFMRAHDSDYFENSRRATYVQREYAIRNPMGFAHVGENCWGITASDGPGIAGQHARRVDGIDRVFGDYMARGAPFGPDDGTLAPWAVAASMPFAPEIVVPALQHLRTLDVHSGNPYGFKASFNPAFRADDRDDGIGWVSPYHFGVNEGPTVLMIENFSSGKVWEWMRRCPHLKNGLRKAGFTGGWVED